MRKTISLICAVALLLACIWGIYHLLFVSPVAKAWWVGGIGMLLVIALFWIWEDFLRPIFHRPS